MEPITFQFKLSEKDFERASIHIMWKYFSRGPRVIIYSIIMLALLANLLFQSHGMSSYTNVFLLIWISGASVFIWWRMKVGVRNTWRNNFRSQENIHYEITEEKLVQSGDTFRLDTPWEKVQGVEVWKEFYLMYLAKNRAMPVPRNVLSPDQEQRFNELLDRVKPGWR